MSHFLNLESFRKGGVLKKGDINNVGFDSYQDPTYLSFTLLFDMQLDSPLFNGEAERFIQKHLVDGDSKKYQHKLDSLKAFKNALYKINSEMPWHWQSLGGVDRLVQFNPENPYFGGSEAKLTIGCLETINMNIAGLMQLYRKAIWDEKNWRYILPPNLRKFTMYIYVADVRSIYDNSPNEVIAGEGSRPFFMFELRYCEFDMTSGNKPLADLSASAPEMAANEIIINYDRVYRVDARALNGLVIAGMNNETGINLVSEKPDTIAPVTDMENTKAQVDPSTLDPNAGLDEETAGKIAKLEAANSGATDPGQTKKLSFKQQVGGKMKNLKNKAVKQLKDYGDRSKDDLARMARMKAEEAQIEATRLIMRRLPTLENVYGKIMRGIDAATDIKGISAGVESVVGKNVHFLDGTPIVDVLDKANRDALISMGNVYNDFKGR
jgi:hypothetical protein